MVAKRFAFITHNVNGDGTPQIPSDLIKVPHKVVITQEANGHLLRNALPAPRWGHWIPEENDQLSFSWTKQDDFFFERVGGGIIRLHKSGKALGLPDKVKTHARHLAYINMAVNFTALRFANTHLINSGYPIGPDDPWTDERKELWDKSWVKVKAFAQETHDEGRLLVMGMDGNRMDIPDIPGMKKITGRGLDVIYVSKSKRLDCEGVFQGPLTGTSGRVHHHSEGALLKVGS